MFRSRTTRVLRLGAVTAGVALTIAACGNSSPRTTSSPPGSSRAPSAQTVNIEYYPGSFYTWLVDLASKAGFFARNRIDAHMIPVSAGGPVAFAGLANGSAQLAMGDTSLGGPLMDKGVGLRVVSGASSGGWVLVAPKGEALGGPYPDAVRSLRGKPIGVVSLGSSAYAYARQFVIGAGLPPDSVTYQALGGVPAEFVSAIDSGRVAAAITDPVTAYLLVVLQHNQVIISTGGEAQSSIYGPGLNAAKLLPPSSPLLRLAGYPGGWEFTTASFAAAHPAAVARIRLALEETDVWMHNPANLQTVAADLEDTSNIPAFVTSAHLTDAFLRAILPLIVSWAPVNGIAAFQTFWINQGLLTKALPLNQWYVPGIAQSAGAVVDAVDAAGHSDLGSSA